MFVTLRDGLRLHLRDLGAGDPVVMLHGFTGSGEAWGGPVLRQLASKRRVLAVDLPGHGRSDAPTQPARYALDAILEDLIELLDAVEISRAVWAGYSMGGRIALGAGILHPNRVTRLIVESASPGLEGEAEREARQQSDEALATRIEAGGIDEFVRYWTDLPLFATQRRLSAEVRETIRRRRLRNRPGALAACLRGLGTGSQPSFWGELARVRVATLVIAGSEDSRYRQIGTRMSAEIPDSTLALIRGAGHTTHLEAPAVWLEAVERFLDSGS